MLVYLIFISKIINDLILPFFLPFLKNVLL